MHVPNSFQLGLATRLAGLLRGFMALVLVTTAATACAQISDGLYCTSGLRPDGYIDFSDLPPAPKFKAGQPGSGAPAMSVPVIAKLPVHGVAGLSVTVTIPALAASEDEVYAYSVDGGTLQLNGLPVSPYGSPGNLLTLDFSQKIHGVGLNTLTYGRFDYSYSLQADYGLQDASAPEAVAFATTASGYTDYLDTPQTQTLQMVGVQTVFPTAVVQFLSNEGEYYDITLSNLRVQSVSALAAVIPRKGLEQWLRADTALDGVSTWQDQSGHGHNATPVNGVGLTADGRNCQAAFAFTGAKPPAGIPGPGYFTFDLPIAGWDQMTIFLVASATKDGSSGAAVGGNAALLWTEDASWGNTFLTPSQTHAFARFGTTQANNNLSYQRPGGGVGQDFTLTRAVHDSGTDSLFVDGVLALSQNGKFASLAGVSGAGTIGKGINNTFFEGEISEILVYDRVLTDNEAAQVEQYLRRKYGIE